MSQTNFLDLQRLADQQKPELGVWLRSVMQRWRDGEPLERAADLKGNGALQAAKQELLVAADLLDPDHKHGPWRLAGIISQAFKEFERRRWPAARTLSAPDGLSALDQVFWRTLTNSSAVPRSQDRIFDLLAQRRQLRQCATLAVWLTGKQNSEVEK
jgi:hypothetical protein